MTIGVADVTTLFPELANSAVYPVATINAWITQGYANLPACQLGASLDFAVMLYAAHNTVLGVRNANASAAGGVAGDVSGPISSKAVGGVSKSYDVGAVTISGAGPWNATTYGQRLYKMLQGAVAGGAYIPPNPANPALFPPFGFLPPYGNVW